MPEYRIGLIGICTFDGSIGPKGNHLRWSFPPALGFPPKGFQIYRKTGGTKVGKGLDFGQLPLNTDLPDDLRLGDVELIAHPAGRRLRCVEESGVRVLRINPPFLAQLEVRFSRSIAYARVRIASSGSGNLRAYQDKKLLAAVSFDAQTAEVSCAGITRLTIDLGSRRVGSIEYATEADVCNDPNWTEIKTLPLPIDVLDPLTRFEEDLDNYYANSGVDAKKRYEQAASDIVTWLKPLLSPTDEFFEQPEKPPNELKIRSSVEGPVSSGTYLQSVFLLAALDPNVARLMSLYWVDAFEPSIEGEEGPPDQDQLYDYKVEAYWPDNDVHCGLVFSLGQTTAPRPPINPDLVGEQLSGLRWIDGQPFGRLGLKWPRPAIQNSPQARAVQPVLYEITRIFGEKHKKIPEPVLVDDASWSLSPPAAYVDRDLALGTYTYEVRPIDLFGQLGSSIKTSIELNDLEAPPPPIRTRVDLSRTDTAASLRLQFEFGASQHQQAPDISKFWTYWKPDALLSRLPVNVDVTSVLDPLGKFHHTLRMSDGYQEAISVSTLRTFVGDVLTNVIHGAQPPLRASQRRRYRIAEVKDDGRVVLEPTSTPMADGPYELVQDPHNRLTWLRLEEQTISWREPISGILQRTDKGLPVEVLNVTPIPARPDPLAFIPPEKRGRQFPALPPAQGFVLVEINRLLTEPDVFAGGIATPTARASIEVIYAISNIADGRTRIALPAGSAIAEGDTLTLFPAAELAEKVRLLRISGSVDSAPPLTPGGEIAFEHKVNGEDVTVIMRVISNAVNQTAAFDLVVRTDNARDTRANSAQDIGALQPNLAVRYYAPYILTFPVALEPNTNAPIELLPGASLGYHDGFVAVSAIDLRNNEGPLGTPAQFSVIRPKPDPPSVPYPCGLSVSAPAGYASPPNRAGRATTCLTWDTPVPAEGIRYEVARALDNSILAAHLRDWQMGKITEPLALPVITGQTVEGSLGDVTLDSDKGLIRAAFEPDTSVADPAIFRNGRLERNGAYFQVTLAKSAGTNIDLLLRGPSAPLPSSGRANLEAPPNYSEASNDTTALQDLARDVPDAFALVTGVPIDSNRFIDDVAGKGRNRFFYRVRVVDAAENRSGWSAVSAPFYQVDTTPPEVPNVSGASGGDRRAEIRWSVPSDRRVVEYQVFRATNPEALDRINPLQPFTVLSSSPLGEQQQLANSPFIVRRGQIDLSDGSVLPDGVGIASVGPNRFVAVLKRDGVGSPESFNYLVASPTQLIGRRVTNVNPALADGTEIVTVLADDGDNRVELDLNTTADAPLTVTAGIIDLTFPYQISEVLGVYLQGEFDDTVVPIENQLARNYVTSASAYHIATHTIERVHADLEDGLEVVAMIRDAAGIKVLRHRLDGFPLVANSSKVALDMGLTPTEVVGIFKREFYDPGRSVEDQPSVNYHMARATTYDPVTRKISNLNPLLADGDEVIIQYEDPASALVSIDSNPIEFRFVDIHPQPLEYDSIFYSLVAVKWVRVGNGDDEFIRVPSRPTPTIKLSLFDATTPEPPLMEIAQWFLGGEEPAIELAWTSQGGRFCLLQRRAVDTGRWKSVGDWVGPTVTSNQGARFEFRDVGVDPQVRYRYRTIVRNRFGRTNTVFIEIEVNPINGGEDG